MLRIIQTEKEDSFKNNVYMKNPPSKYLELTNDCDRGIFNVEHKDIEDGKIMIPQFFRTFLNGIIDSSIIFIEKDISEIPTANMFVTVKNIGNNKPTNDQAHKDLENLDKFFSGTIMNLNCDYVFRENNHIYKVTCDSISSGDLFAIPIVISHKYIKSPPEINLKGIDMKDTKKEEYKKPTRIETRSNYNQSNEMFNGDFDFEKMGIGGQAEAFKLIFRNAFAPFLLMNESKSMGSTPIRGILLYGPPGCGKTLIARQLAKNINAKTFKIVNGPEIKDKYVSESERFIRELFYDAEEAMKNKEPGIHIIVFDEFDSIASKRTEGSSGSYDLNTGIVNQLLSKIDGVDELNNILIIGMTNRKSAIDPAILRSGRLELHIEITVPDKQGRTEILKIHSKDLVKNGHLSSDVNFDEIADITVNYSGAELKSLLNKASAFSMVRLIDPNTMKKISDEKPIIRRSDILTAMREIIPIMGSTCKDVQVIINNPISLDDENYRNIYETIKGELIEFYTNKSNIKVGNHNIIGRNFTILLMGPSYSGKTKMIAHIVSELSNIITHLRFINPEYYLNNNSNLWKEFEEGKRINNFLMVIDSLETIIEKISVGNESQSLKTILGCNIEDDKSVSTIVTCSDIDLINNLRILNKFIRVYEIGSGGKY